MGNRKGIRAGRALVIRGRAVALLCASVVAPLVRGGTLQWSASRTVPPSGGGGSWDLAGINWFSSVSGSYGHWVNGSAAEFGGAPGTVTLGVNGIQAGSLQFDTAGYVLAGGGHTLALTSPTISLLGGNATISALVSSNDTLTVSNPVGALTLSGGGSVNALNVQSGGAALSGGTWTLNQPSISNALLVGGAAAASLTVSGGATVGTAPNLGGAVIGGSSPATLTVTDPGTSLSIGYLTDIQGAATVTVQNGSAMTVTSALRLLSPTSSLVVNAATFTSHPFASPVNTGTINLTDPAAGHALTINGASQFFGVYAGTITGTGSLLKTGASEQDLQGASTYSGGTVLQGGIPAITQDGALGTGPITFQGGTLRLDANSKLNFSNAPALQLGAVGGSPKTLSGSISGSSALAVVGPGTLTLTGSNTYTGTTTVRAGTLAIGAAGALPAGADVTNAATLQINADSSPGRIIGGGTLNVGGATLAVPYFNQGGINVQPGGSIVLQKSALQLSTASSLVLASTAKLVLSDQLFRINYGTGASPRAMIRSYLSAGYDAGKWDGFGITTALAGPNRAIGYADSSDGVLASLPAGTLQLQLAIPGDTNLDGAVNLADLLTLTRNFGNTNADWAMGDFDYDSKVDMNDFQLLIRHFAGAFSPAILASLSAVDRAQVQSLMAQIPEPGGTAVQLLNALLFARWRRRRPL